MKALVFLIGILFTINSCKSNKKEITLITNCKPQELDSNQKSILIRYLRKGAFNYNVFSQGWQNKIDSAISLDSSIAYLWQQKAMPLFKHKKYELGEKALQKAVNIDACRWQDYQAFMICIFSKKYEKAINLFEQCKKRAEYGVVMDHSYDFYIAISKIQLNQFNEAEIILTKDIKRLKQERGEDWLHFLDLFYLGISQFEQGKYVKAIESFDRSINLYPQFSDAKFYKSKSLIQIGDSINGIKLLEEAHSDFENGYTINEDNAVYETYPYQINWDYKWSVNEHNY